MCSSNYQYELPRDIERYMATLSKYYEKEGHIHLQEILVNANIRVSEGWSHDNWNGGTYGHALYLILPEELYLEVVDNKDDLQKQIVSDINKMHSVQNEFIQEIIFEVKSSDENDWRKNSGLLIANKKRVFDSVEKRIWGDAGYCVFLSHKAEEKKRAANLKENLKIFGISCFVAHEDIHPTKEWQDEIENALISMDAFVALMTDQFHDSCWTDQEVGFAFGRGVPILCVRMGKDPYGFIGKFQALSCSWDEVPREIVKIFIKYDRMKNAYITAVQNCQCYDDANTLSKILPFIEILSESQIKNLIAAYSNNSQIHDSFGFNGNKPCYYGNGLAWHLTRITGQEFSYNRSLTKILRN